MGGGGDVTWDQGGSCDAGEKWSDSTYVLKVELIGFFANCMWSMKERRLL